MLPAGVFAVLFLLLFLFFPVVFPVLFFLILTDQFLWLDTDGRVVLRLFLLFILLRLFLPLRFLCLVGFPPVLPFLDHLQ